MKSGIVCFVESRIHEIGGIVIVGFLEKCGKFVPVGAEDIEAGSRDYVVSIPEQWIFPTARQGHKNGLGSSRFYERDETYQNLTPAASGGIRKVLVTFVGI